MNNQPQQVNIDPSDCDDVLCAHCDCPLFITAEIVKRIPAILVAAPQDQPAGLPVKVCLNCRAPFEHSWQEAIKKASESDVSPLLKP